jgi:hypothetical protein
MNTPSAWLAIETLSSGYWKFLYKGGMKGSLGLANRKRIYVSKRVVSGIDRVLLHHLHFSDLLAVSSVRLDAPLQTLSDLHCAGLARGVS